MRAAAARVESEPPLQPRPLETLTVPDPSPSPWAWRRIPLHWRAWVSALAALLVGMSMLLLFMTQVAQRSLMEEAQLRAQLTADQHAESVSQRLLRLQRAARLVASDVGEAALADETRLSAHLERQRVFRSLYDNVFVTDAKGQMLVYADGAGLRHPGQSIGDRPYFQRLLKHRQPVVSEPVIGRVFTGPVVVILAPIIHRDGHIIGTVGGALRLTESDLLVDLAQVRRADDRKAIVTDGAGIILAHSDASTLMKSLHEVEGLSEATTGPWRDIDAARTVAVASTVSASGWKVWVLVTPNSMAALLRPAVIQSLTVAAALALLLSAMLLAFLQRQFKPLAWLAEHVQALSRGEVTLPPAIRDDAGEPGRLARVIEAALAERTAAESDLRATQHRLTQALAASPVGMVFSRQRKLELLNDEAARLLGWPLAALQGRPAEDIYASRSFYEALGPRVAHAFAHQGVFTEDVQMRHATGRSFWVRLSGRPVNIEDPDAGTIWSFHDIDRDVASRRKLEHAALHDRLTGLPNRDVFMSRLEEVFISSASLYDATVLMLDLDHFKAVNDRAGHAAGDAVLVAVAKELQLPLRAQDLVARLGGDEFAVILAECDAAGAQSIAQRLIQSVQKLRIPWNGSVLQVGITVGLSERASHHHTAAAWLASADAALYEAKRAERGTMAAEQSVTTAKNVVPFAKG